MKKFLTVLTAGCMLLNLLTVSVFGATATGKIINDKAYVPLRGVFEELGFTVEYNSDTGIATIKDDNYTITVPKNKDYFEVNGRIIAPDYPQIIVDGSMYLPLRAIGDSIKFDVDWDKDNKIARIAYEWKSLNIKCQDDNQNTNTSTLVGMIINSADGNQEITVPMLDVLQIFNIIPETNIVNKNGDEEYNGDIYTVETTVRYLNIYKESIYKKSIPVITYNEIQYCNIKEFCETFNINYSYNKNNNIAHLNYENQDIYIKYPYQFNLAEGYPENIDVPVLNKVPDYISTKVDHTSTSYYYYYDKDDLETFENDFLTISQDILDKDFKLVEPYKYNDNIAYFYKRTINNKIQTVIVDTQYNKIIKAFVLTIVVYNV